MNYEEITPEDWKQLQDYLASPEYRHQQIDVWQGNMQKAQARGDEEAVKTCWNVLTYYMYPFKPTRTLITCKPPTIINQSVE